MKTFLFTLATLVAGVMAQDINSLPECERNCVESMLKEGPNYGCPNTDNGGPAPDCLCSKPAFAYGVRDCSSESCPSGTNITQVSEYGLQYCQSAQASASGTSLAAIALFSSAAASSGTSESAAASSSSSSSSREPITTVPVVSTITSDGSTTESTVGSSTIYSGESVSSTSSADSSSSASETAVTTSAIVSTVSESSTTRTTTVGSTTVLSSASSEGAGPTMAAPRLVPRFGGQQADIKDPFWIVRALAYTGFLVFAVQMAWAYAGAW